MAKATITLVDGSKITLDGGDALGFYLEFKEPNDLGLTQASNSRRLNNYINTIAGLFTPAAPVEYYEELPEGSTATPKLITAVPGTGRATPYLSGYEGDAFVTVAAESINSVALSD